MSLDAAVVDSQVLGAFRLGGTAAAFFSWGDPALVVLTLGGFYPGFDPSPAQVPPQQRISLALTSPLPGLRLSASGYVAATTGTLQLGGSLTAAYDIDVAAVRGTIAGDALIQLSPLWFTATLRGSASIEAFEHEVASVDCTATLTGPGPLTLTVTASTSILWEDVGGTVDFDLSGGVGADRTPADSLKGAVERALSEPGNLACETGSDPLVRPSMPTQPPAFPLVSPVGAVVWKQQGFPLGSAVQKAEGRILHTAATITITAPPGAGAVNQRLATSAFLDLTDSLALGVAPYQDHQVGVSIPVTPEQSPATSEVTTDFRTVVLPINTGNTFSSPFQPNAAGVSTALRAATGAPALMAGPPPLTRVLEEAWTVVDPAGGTPGKTTPAAALARAATDPQVVAVPLLAWET
jgi:hypothetical protein